MQSLYEVLGPYNNLGEKEDNLKELECEYSDNLVMSKLENVYFDFIKDQDGLYKILKESILKYNIPELYLYYDYEKKYENYSVKSLIDIFCQRYGFKHIAFKNGNYGYVDFIADMKSMTDVRNLLNAFYGELQQIEHFGKTADELWQEYKEFNIENRSWIQNRKEKNR